MTWPFENDTSAIVKKLADRSMKADKRRNAFIIITIAFAVSLMMVLALYNLGTDRENRLCECRPPAFEKHRGRLLYRSAKNRKRIPSSAYERSRL